MSAREVEAFAVGSRVEVRMGDLGWHAGEVLHRQLDETGTPMLYAVRLDTGPPGIGSDVGVVASPPNTRRDTSEKPR